MQLRLENCLLRIIFCCFQMKAKKCYCAKNCLLNSDEKEEKQFFAKSENLKIQVSSSIVFLLRLGLLQNQYVLLYFSRQTSIYGILQKSSYMLCFLVSKKQRSLSISSLSVRRNTSQAFGAGESRRHTL